MPVTGKIGNEEVYFNNAAEEETLRKLLHAVSGTKSNQKSEIQQISKGIKASNEGLDRLNSSGSEASDNLTELASTTKRTGKDFGMLSKDLKWHSKDLFNSFKNADPKGILDSATEIIKDGLTGIEMVQPEFAPAVEAAKLALTGLSAAAGATLAAVENFDEKVKELAKSGVILGEGVGTFNHRLLDADMTLGQYTRFVSENSDALRVLGGSTSEGGKRIVELRKKLIGAERQFTSLGYSIEQMPDILADFAESVEYGGGTLKNMDSTEIQQRTADYAANLKIIANITGQDAKERKAAARAAAAQGMNQSYLLELRNKGIEGAFDIFGSIGNVLQSKLGEPAAKLWSQYNTPIGTALDSTTALFEQANPELATGLKELRDKVANGQVSVADAETQLLEMMKKIPENALRAGEMATAKLGYYESLGAKISGFEASANQFITGIETIIKTDIPALKKEIQDARTTRDEVTESIRQLEEAKQKLATLESEAATSLVTLTGPTVTKSLKNLVGSVDWAAEQLRIKTFPEQENQIAAIARKLETSPDKVTGEERDDLIKALRSEERTRIEAAGGIEGWAKWIGEPLLMIGDQLEDLTGTGRLTIGDEELIKYSKETLKYLQDNKVQGLLPADQAKLQSQQSNPGISQNSSQVDQNINTNVDRNAPPQAKGNIFDYKPGGHKVTVAELSDEIVAPAKRGADGKLGLEVTGVMLDNSKLLQSLVKINEGQANLIAGLNSKIEGMTASMDRMVSEQRQANRLAV